MEVNVMSKYAYRDKTRTHEILASEAQNLDKNTCFYCPNPVCDAHLYISSVDGVVSAYFAAKDKKHPHIAGCEFHTNNYKFISSKFKEDEFDLETALMQLAIPKNPNLKTSPNKTTTGTESLKPPHTIRQIYSMCKAYSCKDSYNNIEISRILLDYRSFDMYEKGVVGWHLVEAYCTKPLYYNSKKEPKEMYLKLSKNYITYNFILEYVNSDLFKEINKVIYNNRDKKIVVSAKWEKTNECNSFSGKITSKQQILVTK